ncbi:MAG: PRK06851 family protein [Tepidanaerobacteraceae bacterium]
MSRVIKRYFPGGNTPEGYFSHYDQVISWEKANKIFIIKGGPGAGKSSFMRKIADEFLKKGIGLEFFHCSADSKSIDGLVLPEYKIALLDGTAPHVIDPKFPGCVDDIINLGDYWDEYALSQNRQKIQEVNNLYGKCYKRVYNYLKAAKIILEDIVRIYKDAVDTNAINSKTDKVINEIFKEIPYQNKMSEQRHLFASAITPDGIVHFLDCIFGDVSKRFIIKGSPGTGKSDLMKRICDNFVLKGFDVDVFHCPMEPSKIDHLLVTELDYGFITSVKPHNISQIQQTDQIIDLDFAVDTSKVNLYKQHLDYDNELFWALIHKSVEALKEAKGLHDQMEQLYSSNIDFKKIDDIREKLLSRMLKQVNNTR